MGSRASGERLLGRYSVESLRSRFHLRQLHSIPRDRFVNDVPEPSSQTCTGCARHLKAEGAAMARRELKS